MASTETRDRGERWAWRAALAVGAAALVALPSCGLEPLDEVPGAAGADPDPPSREGLPPPGYALLWSDEFDGRALDPSRWTALSGPRRDAVATPAAVSVAGGLATITTYTEAGVHHTGFLTTEGKFSARYGYFEARIRFNDAPGAWCAFWLSAPTVDDTVGSPETSGVEIDVVEHRVTDTGGWDELADMVALNLNWDGYGVDRKNLNLVTRLPGGAPVQGEWHTYAVLWDESGYVFYVDDVELWRPQAPVSRIPQDVYLTCEVDDATWAGFVPTGGYGSRLTSAARMEVDWVRVWQRP